jgi:hypothetical protein
MREAALLGNPAQAVAEGESKITRRLAGPLGTHGGDSNRDAAGRRDKRCPSACRVGVKLSSRAIAEREARVEGRKVVHSS